MAPLTKLVLSLLLLCMASFALAESKSAPPPFTLGPVAGPTECNGIDRPPVGNWTCMVVPNRDYKEKHWVHLGNLTVDGDFIMVTGGPYYRPYYTGDNKSVIRVMGNLTITGALTYASFLEVYLIVEGCSDINRIAVDWDGLPYGPYYYWSDVTRVDELILKQHYNLTTCPSLGSIPFYYQKYKSWCQWFKLDLKTGWWIGGENQLEVVVNKTNRCRTIPIAISVVAALIISIIVLTIIFCYQLRHTRREDDFIERKAYTALP